MILLRRLRALFTVSSKRPPVPVAISRWSNRDALTPTGEQRAFLAHVDTAYDHLARRDPTMIRIDVDVQGRGRKAEDLLN